MRQPPVQEAAPEAGAYRWVALAACTLLIGAVSVVWHSFSVFLVALTEAFPWSRAEAALGFSIFVICSGLTGPNAGMLIRRFGAGRVVQQCGVGLVTLRQDGERWAFAAPPMSAQELAPSVRSALVEALGLRGEQVRAARLLDNGPKWFTLLLGSAQEVLAIEPDLTALARIGFVGVVGPHPEGREVQFEVRAFAAPDGIAEDPVTGSLNASIAQWLVAAGLAPRRYVAAQGTRLGRAGRVHIDAADDVVWVGGRCCTCIDGTVQL